MDIEREAAIRAQSQFSNPPVITHSATHIDGQFYVVKILESVWEILDLSLGVTIFIWNCLMKNKLLYLWRSPSALMWFLLLFFQKNTSKQCLWFSPLLCVPLTHHYNEAFVSTTQWDLLLSMSLIAFLYFS